MKHPIPSRTVLFINGTEMTEPPSRIERIINLAKAVVRHAGDKFTKVSQDEHDGRMAICKGTKETPKCECFNDVSVTCDHKSCGCFIGNKTWWRSESCPLGKW